MAHESEEFSFGYLRRLEDGRVLGRVAFDTTEHAHFPELELGRVGVAADVRARRARRRLRGLDSALPVVAVAYAAAARARDARQRDAVSHPGSALARALITDGPLASSPGASRRVFVASRRTDPSTA